MAELRKRVVILQPNFPPRITGTFDPSVHQVRDRIRLQDDTRVFEAALAAITDHAIYYREIPA